MISGNKSPDLTLGKSGHNSIKYIYKVELTKIIIWAYWIFCQLKKSFTNFSYFSHLKKNKKSKKTTFVNGAEIDLQAASSTDRSGMGAIPLQVMDNCYATQVKQAFTFAEVTIAIAVSNRKTRASVIIW